METVRLIGMTICITAVCAAIFSMLVPNAKLADTLKFAISLFFIAGIISPFVGGDLSFDFSSDLDFSTQREAVEMNTAVSQSLEGAIETRLAARVEQTLAGKGYPVKKVTVDVNITDKDGISINRITVFTDENGMNKKAELNEIVSSEFGIGAEITI